MEPSFALILIGCAECRWSWTDEPLVETVLTFTTVEEAKQHVATGGSNATWNPHPLGGEFYGHSSGDWWIAPSNLFVKEVADGH